ncbi:MAG TPA: LrgB family protein, partial [Steroidobacteraceae bacterium]|nr:LrgB family protein [Steroidobacteraceae bacterium]
IPQYFTLLLNLNFVPYWPVLAFTIVYHAELVAAVFGGKYIAQSWLLPLSVLFMMISAIATPVTLVAQYEERAGLILLSKITALYNIAALLVLVPVWGLYGAMLARGSAVALKNGFIWWFVRRRAVWVNFVPFMLTGVLLWGSVTLVCYAMKTYIEVPRIVHLVLGAVVCALAVPIYTRTRAICRSDREILASLFRGREARPLEWIGLLRPVGNGGTA